MFYTKTYKVEPHKNIDPRKYIFPLYYTKKAAFENTRDCICKERPILNRDHGYIVTRDLCFIGNEHLRKLLPHSIWWGGGTKNRPPPCSFSSVTSTNVGIIP